jgi:hypothetical protein
MSNKWNAFCGFASLSFTLVRQAEAGEVKREHITGCTRNKRIFYT